MYYDVYEVGLNRNVKDGNQREQFDRKYCIFKYIYIQFVLGWLKMN